MGIVLGGGGRGSNPQVTAIMALSADLKERGNAAFQERDFAEARRLFSEGIAVDGGNHVLYSNRSAAHAGLEQYTEALVRPLFLLYPWDMFGFSVLMKAAFLKPCHLRGAAAGILTCLMLILTLSPLSPAECIP